MSRAWGDEHGWGVSTIHGHPITRTAGGWWTYVRTGGAVGSAAPPPPSRPLRDHRHAVRSGPQQTRLALTAGDYRLLVVVVDFTPSQSQSTDEAYWSGYAFTGGANAPHSVAEYWRAASGDAVRLVPAMESYGATNNGVVFVTLPFAHPNPDRSRGALSTASRAVAAADPFVDFAAFDDDGNRYVTNDELQVLIVARGYEKSYRPQAPCPGVAGVWAHAYSFGGAGAPVLDGVTLFGFNRDPVVGWERGCYMMVGEAHCGEGERPHAATIGPAAHELGHCLGAGVPDLYDSDGSSRGIGQWGLMGGGSWNRSSSALSGTSPSLLSAWSRWYLGLITPRQVQGTETLTLPRISDATTADGGVVLLLNNANGMDWAPTWANGPGTGEYFLIENRQQTGFDVGLPGAGLLIWHVDESVGAPGANDDERTAPGGRRLLALEQADGRYDLECYTMDNCNGGDASDAWPTPDGKSFTAQSTPSTTLNNRNTPCAAVFDISESGRTMTARFQAASATEVCDSIDNNCDGNIDEGGNPCGGACMLPAALGSPCDGPDADACEDDTAICAGYNELGCTGGADNVELCDDIDNDCDGELDEGDNPCGGACALVNPPGSSCDGRDDDLCTDDRAVCAGLNETLCSSGASNPELCNLLDDDCDGEVDEGFDVGAACTVGVGACANPGVMACPEGGGKLACTARAGAPRAELCNGVDDDCDGAVDEDPECEEGDCGCTTTGEGGGKAGLLAIAIIWVLRRRTRSRAPATNAT